MNYDSKKRVSDVLVSIPLALLIVVMIIVLTFLVKP